jgi:predicted GIY-YIG superfamily endonuclease
MMWEAHIYQLRLRDGHYYVGRCVDAAQRLERHTRFPSALVARHGPVQEMFIIETVPAAYASGQEDKAVAALMWSCGVNKVRGGSCLASDDYTRADALFLSRFIAHHCGLDFDTVRRRLLARDLAAAPARRGNGADEVQAAVLLALPGAAAVITAAAPAAALVVTRTRPGGSGGSSVIIEDDANAQEAAIANELEAAALALQDGAGVPGRVAPPRSAIRGGGMAAAPAPVAAAEPLRCAPLQDAGIMAAAGEGASPAGGSSHKRAHSSGTVGGSSERGFRTVKPRFFQPGKCFTCGRCGHMAGMCEEEADVNGELIPCRGGGSGGRDAGGGSGERRAPPHTPPAARERLTASQ